MATGACACQASRKHIAPLTPISRVSRRRRIQTPVSVQQTLASFVTSNRRSKTHSRRLRCPRELLRSFFRRHGPFSLNPLCGDVQHNGRDDIAPASGPTSSPTESVLATLPDDLVMFKFTQEELDTEFKHKHPPEAQLGAEMDDPAHV